MKPLFALLVSFGCILAQVKYSWTAAEQPIYDRVHTLRSVPDAERPAVTKDLALQIRQLPVTAGRLILAAQLVSLVREGDPGREALQETGATYAAVLHDQPNAPKEMYSALAALVRYEHVKLTVAEPQFAEAMKELEATDERRQHLDFTLTSLDGKTWNLKQLAGKVVLVNFWATWCPPCRKEMPDLDALYAQYRDKGLVVLAITDEDREKVEPFLTTHKVNYPVLLDPGRKVNGMFEIQGIPKTFIYDRSGRIVAESIDMRTRGQFLEMLSRAGL